LGLRIPSGSFFSSYNDRRLSLFFLFFRPIAIVAYLYFFFFLAQKVFWENFFVLKGHFWSFFSCRGKGKIFGHASRVPNIVAIRAAVGLSQPEMGFKKTYWPFLVDGLSGGPSRHFA
jgi:hypothetical protein